MTSNQIVQQAAGQGEGETRAGPVASLAGAWPITILLVLTVLVPVEFGFSLGSLFFTWAKVYPTCRQRSGIAAGFHTAPAKTV